MTTNVGGLIADIGLNVAMLRADVGKANAELSRGTALMNRSLAGLQRQVGQVSNAFKLLAGAAGLGMIANKVRTVVQEVDGLAKAAKVADVTAESLQELRFAFGQIADVNDQEVDQALQRFTQRLGDAATGNKELAKSFAAVGVSVSQSTEGALDDALKSLAAIENDAARAARASDLFGDKIGPKLAQALQGGIGELERMRQTAHELGIVLSDELVARAEETADQFDVLGRVLGVGFQSMILENVKVVQSFSDAFMNLANWAFAAGEKIVDFATAAGEIAAGALGFGAEADVLNEQIVKRRQQRGALSANIERARGGSVNLARTRLLRSVVGNEANARFGSFVITAEQAQTLLAEMDAEIGRLVQEQIGVMTSGKNTPRGLVTVPSVSLTGSSAAGGRVLRGEDGGKQGLSAELAEFIDQLERGAKLTADMRTEVEKQVGEWREATALFEAGVIDEQTLERVADSLLQPIEVTAKRMPKVIDDIRSEWESVGKSMGSALQDSLANAMLGIETNWKEMIKRMLANAVVNRLLGTVGAAATGPFGAFMSFLGFGGNRAEGGPIEQGKWYIAGERGPEPVWGGGAGAFAMGYGAAGGAPIYITNQIDARGADPSLAARLPKILAENNQRQKAEIRELMRRGRF